MLCLTPRNLRRSCKAIVRVLLVQQPVAATVAVPQGHPSMKWVDVAMWVQVIHVFQGFSCEGKRSRNDAEILTVVWVNVSHFFPWQILFHSWENLMTIWNRMAIWRRRKLYQGKMFCQIPSTATDTSWKEDGFSERRERDRGVRQYNLCLSSPYEWHKDQISKLLF